MAHGRESAVHDGKYEGFFSLLDKLKTEEAGRWCVTKAIEHNWSRNVLVTQIKTHARERCGQAITNFVQQLSSPQSPR